MKYIEDNQLKYENADENLEMKRNRVLEMQVENAFDRGKEFQDKLGKEGVGQQDLKGMMSELEGKMQRVEDILLSDQDRQRE